MFGKFYIVATPIGNLEDITLRAIKTLKEVDLVLAEDTRVTIRLLRHYDIDKPIVSYHQHSSENKKLRILKDLIEGKDIALVTDAGTPGISDPGNELINFIYQNTSPLKTPSLKGDENPIRIIPIPGASAITSALSVSGMNVNRFVFAGFLPKKSLNKFLDQISLPGLPIVFFTSPKRLIKNLDILVEKYGGEKQVVIARELTKMHETIYRGTLEEVIKRFQPKAERPLGVSDQVIKGEVVVVINTKRG